MKLQVLTNPNEKLRKISRPVTDEELQSDETQKLIDNMIETMAEENGVGLAAPQVGEHMRILIAQTQNGAEAFINPKIISRSRRTMESQEGCLSIPGVWGIVERSKTVKIKAKNRSGEPVRLKASGLASVIFQHEIDHLNGILFIDRAKKIQEGEAGGAAI